MYNFLENGRIRLENFPHIWAPSLRNCLLPIYLVAIYQGNIYVSILSSKLQLLD